jgi:hypothetical protein
MMEQEALSNITVETVNGSMIFGKIGLEVWT